MCNVEQARGGGFVDLDAGCVQGAQILRRLERRIPFVGAALCAAMCTADKRNIEPPSAGRKDMGHIKSGLNHAIVLHLRAPKDLLAQRKFPHARQFTFTLQALRREDLVPAVFRIAKDQGARSHQSVVATPQITLLSSSGRAASSAT